MSPVSFNSPALKRFVKEWSSPLIPGLQDDASSAKSEEEPFDEMIPVNATPLRGRSYAESMTADDAKMIRLWLDEEEEKNSVDSSSHSSNKKTIFAAGSPSAKIYDAAVAATTCLATQSFHSPHDKISVDSAFSAKLLSEQKRKYKSTTPSAKNMFSNKENDSPVLCNTFGGSSNFYEVKSPGSNFVFSPIEAPDVPIFSPLLRPVRQDVSRASMSFYETPWQASENPSPSHPNPVHVLPLAQSSPPLRANSSTGAFSIYVPSHCQPKETTSSRDKTNNASTAGTPSRPVLADISKNASVEFVPNSWLTLYHTRPCQADDKETQIQWLQQVSLHFRVPPTQPSNDTQAAPLNVSIYSTASSKFSPLSMPSALQTGRRSPHAETFTSTTSSSFRSILKHPNNAGTQSGGGTSSLRGRLAVRFEHPVTTVKRPNKLLTATNTTTPVTWPNGAPTPPVPGGHTASYLFRDIWEHSLPTTSAVTKLSTKGWIPYQTPESTSTRSSTPRGVPDSQSSESKTTVMISGKENNLDVHSTATKSNQDASTSKSITTRKPLTGKKLDYDRSSSERNILKDSLV